MLWIALKLQLDKEKKRIILQILNSDLRLYTNCILIFQCLNDKYNSEPIYNFIQYYRFTACEKIIWQVYQRILSKWNENIYQKHKKLPQPVVLSGFKQSFFLPNDEGHNMGLLTLSIRCMNESVVTKVLPYYFSLAMLTFENCKTPFVL